MAKRSGADASSTPATVALTRLGISFVVHHYDVDPAATSKGLDAARALGVDPSVVFKTLLAWADTSLSVAVVPVDRQLDLKAFASACGAKKAHMAEPADAERSTGYVVGGISPIGQRKRLATVIDAAAMDLTTVVVSAGRRGLQVELAPHDLVAATAARVANIAR